ncbi:hypothetical protein RD792_010540 [Penstemon davidsonii]|uniref:BHLH domain-containing protein n=1 Tax=Penstemon davidsonii TaxID=160366 RepID=A0ABR0D250_9LAMI|nr:hypothetical protein RD792_010540 [Penstemon davidsonii]
MEKENMFLNQNNELNCGFFNPNWENSMDQNDPFESALSSMVSSPTASNATAGNNNNGENIVLRELIGRLGSICNSGEIINNNNSNNPSCYSTPLNSPPKLNLSNHQIRGNLQIPTGTHFNLLPNLASDPGFAERAARFSCFGLNSKLEMAPKFDSGKVSGSQENAEFVDSRENSSLSEQNPGGEIGLRIQNEPNSRKRKSVPKGKGKETLASVKDINGQVGSNNSESNSKRSKSDDEKAGKKNTTNQKQSKVDDDKTEPPKDYIHVRARRGQATDAHSLAERVRREKISERMKFLQDLVPGCNKVTGKAVMLDEIINYVQSLQKQVEFLSMKLATVNPRMDFNIETLVSKDVSKIK